MAIPTGFGGRDFPDFGISDTFQTKSRIDDMGELSARLGSPSIFDRTGTIIYFEQFSHGLNNWLLTSNPHGVDPYLISSPFLYKPYAVELETLFTGAGTSTMQIILPFPYESPMGVEFAYFPVFPVTELEFYGELYTGTDRYVFDIEYDFVNGEISLWDENGAYQVIYTDVNSYHLTNTYNITKVVVDLDQKAYNRLVFNKWDIDLTDYPLITNTSAVRPRLTLLWRLEATNAQVETLYIDNIVVTLDEPIA